MAMNVLRYIYRTIPLSGDFNMLDGPFKPPPPPNIYLSSTLALEVVVNLHAFGWLLFHDNLTDPEPVGSVSICQIRIQGLTIRIQDRTR